jgi:hypothetical protein
VGAGCGCVGKIKHLQKGNGQAAFANEIQAANIGGFDGVGIPSLLTTAVFTFDCFEDCRLCFEEFVGYWWPQWWATEFVFEQSGGLEEHIADGFGIKSLQVLAPEEEVLRVRVLRIAVSVQVE